VTRRRLLTLVLVGAGAAIPASLATAGGQALRFVSVSRGEATARGSDDLKPAAKVVDSRIETPLDRLPPVDFRKVFAIYVSIGEPTQGYALRVRRVRLQQSGSLRQLCVVVQRKVAHGAVAEIRTRYWDYVTVPRGKLRLHVPQGLVVRDTRGQLIFNTRVGARTKPALCRV
jgi:hypothetical protein